MKEPLLDTDTLSYYLKGIPNVVNHTKSTLQQYGYLNISVVTYSEALNGLLLKDAKRQMADFLELIRSCHVLPVTQEIAHFSANIQADLVRNGRIIGHTDVMIGATAIHHNLKVVTNNQSRFSQISNLELDNWI